LYTTVSGAGPVIAGSVVVGVVRKDGSGQALSSGGEGEGEGDGAGNVAGGGEGGAVDSVVESPHAAVASTTSAAATRLTRTLS
jgi:hypothetical protein